MSTAAITGITEQQNADISLARVEIASFLVLAAMGLGTWLLASPLVAISVLVGGFTVIASFQWLKRDSRKLAANPTKAARIRFVCKCMGRLAVLALLFYFLVRYQTLHIPGFLMGLATIKIGISLAFISRVKRLQA